MKRRLDVLLVERDLAASRERARALIMAGQVKVDDQIVTKAGTAVAEQARLTLVQPDHPYVGRGGIKLAHALDAFHVECAGRLALDIGASTGGFTDVLLQRGAARVVALDVGHGQMDWRLRNDARVVVLERVNARYLTPETLPEASRSFDIVTIDVSFISLALILPVVPAVLRESADVIALVKPQFEAGPRDVRPGGIVTDPEVRARVVRDVLDSADRVGLSHRGTTESPITGMEGNIEFFVHLRRPC